MGSGRFVIAAAAIVVVVVVVKNPTLGFAHIFHAPLNTTYAAFIQ